MFAIRSALECLGEIRSMDNGTDWYNVDRGWTPASNEASTFETRDEADQVIARESLANAAIVVEIDE